MTTDMIIKELPRIKDTPLPQSLVLLPSNEELRRNQVIQDLLKDKFFYTGQSVRPTYDETYEKEGTARIVGIASTYKAWKGTIADADAQWPDNDNPMIIAARYEKSGHVVNATVNFFKPL